MKMMVKGSIAIAEGAIHAGCRLYFGYPITPQNDIPEYLSAELPKVGGVFLQAESEIASINMILGASAVGVRAMTSSSGPGISLMQEGISYLAGSELPAVIVDVTRTGPGLGGIAGTQGDYKQATRGGGHGDYRTLVLAPSSVQEMFDLTKKAFELADKYRNPVLVLTDAILALMKEPIEMPTRPKKINLPQKPWALTGAMNREPQLIKSLYLGDGEMEVHNWKLVKKYKQMEDEDTYYEELLINDANLIVVAFGSCSRICRSAVEMAREEGFKVGLLRPITLFPFPKKKINEICNLKNGGDLKFLVVEMNTGQMVEDVKLSTDDKSAVISFAVPGGTIPTPEQILSKIKEVI